MEERVIIQTNMRDSEEKFTIGRTGFLLFIAVLFAACFGIGCSSLYIESRFLGLMQLLALLGLGCFHAVMIQKRFSSDEYKSQLLKTVYFSIALFAALGVVYFYKDSFRFFDILGLCCAFLLPSAIAESWIYFNAIPELEKIKETWYYPQGIPSNAHLLFMENTPLVINLIIDSEKVATLKSTVPTTLDLNVALYHAIKNQDPLRNGEETFFNSSGVPYGWVFYKKSLGKKIYLIPDETIFENHLKPNTVLYAERIK